jgi:hypothetical protein
MKIRIVFVPMIALMAGAMAFAQSSNNQSTTDSQSGNSTAQTGGHTDASNDLPATKEGGASSKNSQATPDQRPGVMGTPQTPNTGNAPKQDTPATGTGTQSGSSDDSDTRPATTPSPDSSSPSQK